MRLKVLVAGHSLVNPLNRARIDALSAQDDLELSVLTPLEWTGRHGETYDLADAPSHPGYRLLPHRVHFRGDNQQHLYLYGMGLDRLVAQAAPDLLHIEEEPYSAVTFQLALLAAWRRIPFVITSFQNLVKTHPIPFRWMQSYVLSRAKAALAGSPATEAMLRARGFAGRVQQVALGIDPALYTPSRDEELVSRLKLSGFVAGYVGRLEPVKGLDLLLAAVARLPTLQLVMVGNGLEEERLKALAQSMGIAERVRWQDTVPHAEVPRWLGILDALVLPSVTTPSIQEQFGRVLVEAMACGVPVIGSSSGGIPGVIGDAGLVFPEGDSVALSSCLMQLMRSPARRAELTTAGRARALERYTWDSIARGIAQLYREVAGR